MMEHHQRSQWRACHLVGLQPCSYRYRSRRQGDTPVRQRLKELAPERPRFGYRRLGVLLRWEGHRVNAKRVLRLYREEGLKLRPKRRKRVASQQRISQHH